MTEWTTIRVSQAAKKAAEEEKQPDETWSEYLLRCGNAEVPRKWTKDEIEALIRKKATDVVEEYANSATTRR